MTREEAHTLLEIMAINLTGAIANSEDSVTEQTKLMAKQIEAIDMAIEALKNKPIRCEDCRHRNTWDNPRLDPQYYRCRKGVKFRDYGYVREDDYCPLGERREKNEML